MAKRVVGRIRNGNKAQANRIAHALTRVNSDLQRAVGVWLASEGHEGRTELGKAARDLRWLAEQMVEVSA